MRARIIDIAVDALRTLGGIQWVTRQDAAGTDRYPKALADYNATAALTGQLIADRERMDAGAAEARARLIDLVRELRERKRHNGVDLTPDEQSGIGIATAEFADLVRHLFPKESRHV